MKGKIKNYILNHKIRLLILLVLLIGSVVFAMFSLNSTYNYVIDQYENGHYNIQVCEEGITTLNRMKYYRNSQNYIRQMKRSIIEDYCNIGQFEEAKNYLDRNYEKSIDDMYGRIEQCKKEYDEAQRIKKYNSIEGRTERVEKMYQQMGLGGTDYGNFVVDVLASNLEYGTLEDVGYVLPVWNRNEVYYAMLKDNFGRGQGWLAGNKVTNYYLQSCEKSESIEITKEQYKNYLRKTYRIDVDVQAVGVLTYMLYEDTETGGQGFSNNMLVFAVNDKWFFGGIFSDTFDNTVDTLVPADNQYEGQLIEE